MSTDSPLNVMAPPVCDGTNYQVWVVRMETYLDANDQWEAIADRIFASTPAFPHQITLNNNLSLYKIRQNFRKMD
jgi:hypothetical protein